MQGRAAGAVRSRSGPPHSAGMGAPPGSAYEKRGLRHGKPLCRKYGNYRLLNDLYVYGLLAFSAVADLELDLLTFVERLEPIR